MYIHCCVSGSAITLRANVGLLSNRQTILIRSISLWLYPCQDDKFSPGLPSCSAFDRRQGAPKLRAPYPDCPVVRGVQLSVAGAAVEQAAAWNIPTYRGRKA